MDRMREDIASLLSSSSANALIARGRAAQPALRAITPAIRDVVLWAPIIWVDAPHSDLKRTIMEEVDRNGFAMIDGTRVGREFLHALDDPTDDEVRHGCVPTAGTRSSIRSATKSTHSR